MAVQWGGTILHNAAADGFDKMIELLLAAGANELMRGIE